MKRLNIDLADRSYDILIGRNLLAKTGELIAERLIPAGLRSSHILPSEIYLVSQLNLG